MFSCDKLVGGTRVRGTCRRGKEQNKREHVLLSRVHSYTEYWSRSAGTRLLVSLAARRWLLPPWLQLQLQLRLVPLTPAASHRAWPRDLRNYSPSFSSLYWISESTLYRVFTTWSHEGWNYRRTRTSVFSLSFVVAKSWNLLALDVPS